MKLPRFISLLLILVLLVLAGSAEATQPSVIDTTTVVNNGGGSCGSSLAVPSGMTSNSSVVVCTIAFDAGTTNPTITDTPTGTWTAFLPSISTTTGNAGEYHYWHVYTGETGDYGFTLSSSNPYVQCGCTGWANALTTAPIGDSATTSAALGVTNTLMTGAVALSSGDNGGTLVLDWVSGGGSDTSFVLPTSLLTLLDTYPIFSSDPYAGFGSVYQTAAVGGSGSSATYSAANTGSAEPAYATGAYVIVPVSTEPTPTPSPTPTPTPGAAPTPVCSNANGESGVYTFPTMTLCSSGSPSNDDLVMIMACTSGGQNSTQYVSSITPATGYTQIGDLLCETSMCCGLFYHLWLSGDPTSGIQFTDAGISGERDYISLVISGENTTYLFDPAYPWSPTYSPSQWSNTTNPLSLPAVSPLNSNDLLVFFGSQVTNGGGTPTATFSSPLSQFQTWQIGSNWNTFFGADGVLSDSGSTGPITFDLSNSPSQILGWAIPVMAFGAMATPTPSPTPTPTPTPNALPTCSIVPTPTPVPGASAWTETTDSCLNTGTSPAYPNTYIAVAGTSTIPIMDGANTLWQLINVGGQDLDGAYGAISQTYSGSGLYENATNFQLINPQVGVSSWAEIVYGNTIYADDPVYALGQPPQFPEQLTNLLGLNTIIAYAINGSTIQSATQNNDVLFDDYLTPTSAGVSSLWGGVEVEVLPFYQFTYGSIGSICTNYPLNTLTTFSDNVVVNGTGTQITWGECISRGYVTVPLGGSLPIDISVNASAKTFTTAGSFSWLTQGESVGNEIIFSGFSNAGNNLTCTITAVNATTLTCGSASGLVDETAGNSIKATDAGGSDIIFFPNSGVGWLSGIIGLDMHGFMTQAAADSGAGDTWWMRGVELGNETGTATSLASQNYTFQLSQFQIQEAVATVTPTPSPTPTPTPVGFGGFNGILF